MQAHLPQTVELLIELGKVSSKSLLKFCVQIMSVVVPKLAPILLC